MTIRVTDSYISSILVGDLNRSLGALLKQQRIAGSMRRVQTFADDPRAVGLIQQYNALIANNNEYLDNVNRNRILVDSTDIALQDISEVLADVRVISLRESSGLANTTSQATSVVEVDNLISRLMDVLNTSIEGSYIFGGRRTNTPPFSRQNDSVIYQGDDNQIFSRTGPNSTMAVNIPGGVFLGTQSSSLGGKADMAPQLELTTRLEDLNLGNGWTAGGISLTDGAGNLFEVDLSAAVTVDDVLTAINTEAAGFITASLSADGKGFAFAGAGPITVAEIDGGTTASSLGINVSSAGNLLTGRDIRAGADATTLLSDIPGLSGSLPLGNMDVTWQGTTYTLDFSGAVTLGDLQTTVNGAVPGMELIIRESSLLMVGSSPESFQIVNADGTNTATALGLTGEGNPVRLFGMLEDLKAALAAGDRVAIRGASSELAAMEDSLYQLLMKNGGRQKDLDWAEDILRQRDERLRSNLSLERDADVAQVAADLSRAETSYQASLLVTSKLGQMNLLMYLR